MERKHVGGERAQDGIDTIQELQWPMGRGQ
jgi:hypothetical protein